MSRYRNEETASLWVPGPLPGMNELIAAAKGAGGRGAHYAKLKKQWTDTVWALALSTGIHKPGPFPGRVCLAFRWFERDRRRDPDNVAAGGRKLVLDGLVQAGVIAGDGWRSIQSWTDSFNVSPERPGVAVTILRYAGAVQMDGGLPVDADADPAGHAAGGPQACAHRAGQAPIERDPDDQRGG